MARRKAAVVAELDSRGLDEKLVYTVSMRGYWDLSWWDAKRTGVGLQEAISRLMTTVGAAAVAAALGAVLLAKAVCF
jgi:hypothetical protein